jgi:hypothetical protein
MPDQPMNESPGRIGNQTVLACRSCGGITWRIAASWSDEAGLIIVYRCTTCDHTVRITYAVALTA